jgi:Ricin-type beta-trefoil lectin domain-like
VALTLPRCHVALRFAGALFRDTRDGYVRILNQDSDKCLDVYGATRSDGANVIHFTCGTGASQHGKNENDRMTLNREPSRPSAYLEGRTR